MGWPKLDEKYMRQSVAFSVDQKSGGNNCHIVTVGPRFWGTNVSFFVGQTVRPLWALALDQLSLGLNKQQ